MNKERLNAKLLNEFKQYDFSIIKEKKLSLVGSIKFKNHFIKIESILQINYKKIISICSVDGLLNKDDFSYQEWEQLQEICLAKLKDQDAILVLDVDNYVGDHTIEEIEFFQNNLKKPVYYLTKLRKLG